jgi:hypothetical protein
MPKTSRWFSLTARLIALVAVSVWAVPFLRPIPVGATFGTIEITDAAGTALTSFSIGNPLYITVNDANRNTNAATIEEVAVTVATTTAADTEALTTPTSILKETGVNTGIFRNAGLPTAFKDGASTPNDGLLEVELTDTITTSYTDPAGESQVLDFSQSPLSHVAREAGHVDDGVLDDPAQGNCADAAVYTGDEGAYDPNVVANGGYLSTDRTKWDWQPGTKTTNGGPTVSNIATDNDVRESNKTIAENTLCHGWNIHEFEFKITPFTAATVTSLTLEWRGVHTRLEPAESAALNDAYLLIHNKVGNTWQVLDTDVNRDVLDSVPTPTDVPLSGALATGLSNYVDSSGFVRVLVVEYGATTDNGGGGGLYTDYISLTTTGGDSATDSLSVGGGSIFGTVWNDLDRDGIFDTSEPGLANVSVTLLDDTGTTLVTDKTNADGDYGFIGFPADSYSLRETDPAGFVSTTPNTIGPFTLTSGQVLANQNFGDAQQLSTTGLTSNYLWMTFGTVSALGAMLWFGVSRVLRVQRVPLKVLSKKIN